MIAGFDQILKGIILIDQTDPALNEQEEISGGVIRVVEDFSVLEGHRFEEPGRFFQIFIRDAVKKKMIPQIGIDVRSLHSTFPCPAGS
jgi:hypothetical protein